MKKIIATSLSLLGVFFLCGCGQKPVSQPISSAPATQQPTQSVAIQPLTISPIEKIVGWQTYKNDKYGFEFKYPKGWVASVIKFEDGDKYASLEVTSPAEGHFWIAYYPTLPDVRNIKSGQSLEQHMLQNGEAETGLSHVKLFELLGQKWWFALEAGIASNDPTVFTENNGHVYQVLFVNSAEEYSSPDKMPEIQKEFLANFKFTSQISSTLETVAYNAVDMKTKGVWDKKIEVGTIHESQKAAKGFWWAKDRWDWIAWQKDDGNWTVLVSADGFSCAELSSVPSQYVDFFKDVTYQSGKKYCY